MWCEVASTVLYLKDFIPITRHPNVTPFEDWHGLQPDISHLRPFGCSAYAKIPVETDGGKLAPHAIKCTLIGYFGRDAYHLLDKATGRVYHSWDVIFEEGVGHQTLAAQPVSNEGELDHIILQPTNDVQPTPDAQSDLPFQPTTPHPVPTSQPVPVTQNPQWSTHTKYPSENLLRSQASERDIEKAASSGKEWATNNVPTSAGTLSAYIESTAFATTTNLPDPSNYWLPNSYSEAMTRPDMWLGLIEKELKVMRDRDVWEGD